MITALDIAIKLYRKYRHWTEGPPTFKLIGEEKTIGYIEITYICTNTLWNLYL